MVYNGDGVNIALNGKVTASSYLGGTDGSGLVDGSTDYNYNSKTSIHLGDDDKTNSWIQIDFVNPIKYENIKSIRIMNRADCCQDRIVGTYLSLTNGNNMDNRFSHEILDAKMEYNIIIN